MWFKFFCVAVFILTFTGCASVRKETKNTQIQQLQMQVVKLKDQIQQKDEEIGYLEKQLRDTQDKKVAYKSKARESKYDTVEMTPKNIQLALKNVGLYAGPIDGKIGKETKKAIRDFQKANALTVDGIIGKETWLKLKKYL